MRQAYSSRQGLIDNPRDAPPATRGVSGLAFTISKHSATIVSTCSPEGVALRFPAINNPGIREQLLRHIRAHGSVRNRECRELLGIGYDEAIALFNAMIGAGEIVRVGRTSGIRYVLATRGPTE